MQAPQILGINRTQERKHHWGRLADIELYKKNIPSVERPYGMILECWSADDEIQRKQQYHEELRKELPLTEPSNSLSSCSAYIISKKWEVSNPLKLSGFNISEKKSG